MLRLTIGDGGPGWQNRAGFDVVTSIGGDAVTEHEQCKAVVINAAVTRAGTACTSETCVVRPVARQFHLNTDSCA